MNAGQWDKKTDDEKKEYCTQCVINNNNDWLSIDRINIEINSYRDDYYHKVDKPFEETIFKYLHNLKEYNFAEYKFYCWLCKNKNINPKINSPYSDYLYKNISEDEFKKEYANNEIRKDIYCELESFFRRFGEDERFDKSKIEIIVGGSYITNKKDPEDIDFAICISEKLFKKEGYGREFIFKRKNFSNSKKLDFTFFPINFNENNYYIYNKLTMLFNIATSKESIANKDPFIKIGNNVFTKNALIHFEKLFKI